MSDGSLTARPFDSTIPNRFSLRTTATMHHSHHMHPHGTCSSLIGGGVNCCSDLLSPISLFLDFIYHICARRAILVIRRDTGRLCVTKQIKILGLEPSELEEVRLHMLGRGDRLAVGSRSGPRSGWPLGWRSGRGSLLYSWSRC